MKRSRQEGQAGRDTQPLGPSSHHLTQSSLKDHFRVAKPRHDGKENARDAGAALLLSPPLKAFKSPLLPSAGRRRTPARQQKQQAPMFSFTHLAPHSAAAPAAATPLLSSPPVMSEGGISLSTAPFAFPVPSEDTAGAGGDEFTSMRPGYGTAAAGLFRHRMASPAGAAPTAQPHTLSTADPDEISCRHRPLPAAARPARMAAATSSAATFSSGAGQAGSVGQPEYSTASLASWLPCKGNSSMQAAACAADESDCEDDAVSQRWAAAAPSVNILPDTTPAHMSPAASPAAGGHGMAQRLLAATGAATAAYPVSGSEESDGGVAPAGVGITPALFDQGGSATGVSGQQEGAGRVIYHTRLEELLFGMSYVAPATAEADGAEE